MSLSLTKKIGVAVLALVAFAAVALSLSYAGLVNAQSANPVFLTRNVGVISTYPRNSALSVGTTTSPTQAATTTIGKLNVTLNPGDTFLGAAREGFQKAFQVSSTTTAGGTATSTAELFSIYRTGCINSIATSTATPIKLVLSALGATSTFNGTVYWQYGSCS